MFPCVCEELLNVTYKHQPPMKLFRCRLATQRFLFAVLLTLVWTIPVFQLTAGDWPQWRGRDGQGHADVGNVPLHWSPRSHVKWRSETPGRGWSSPVIAGTEIWLTTALETPAKPDDAARRLKANTGDQPLNLLERVELRAICFDRDFGKLRHNVLLMSIAEPQWVHTLNSYASPSPIADEDYLYCHFGTFGTACVHRASGQLVWANNDLQVMHENGPGGSPVLVGNVIAFNLDGSDKQFIAALNKRTGQLAWRTNRSGEMHPNPQLKKSYGTPIVMANNGSEQIISPGSNWVYGYDPDTGKELWRVGYGELGFSLTPRPVYRNGTFFMATGFGKSQILAIKLGPETPEVVWRFNRGAPTMPSPLLVDNELYFVSDNGILTCLDAASGKENFRERIGGNFCASPTFAGGRIYFSNREGSTYVVAPGTTYKLLAENKLPEGIFASPAIVDGAIYLRTDKALYRLQE